MTRFRRKGARNAFGEEGGHREVVTPSMVVRKRKKRKTGFPENIPAGEVSSPAGDFLRNRSKAFLNRPRWAHGAKTERFDRYERGVEFKPENSSIPHRFFPNLFLFERQAEPSPCCGKEGDGELRVPISFFPTSALEEKAYKKRKKVSIKKYI